MTVSRIKVWASGEKLKASDLNTELNNIIAGLVPASIDDASTNTSAMQATLDPYPGSTVSLPTTLAGEIQALRYVLAQLSGETHWYMDPDSSIASLLAAITALQSAGQWVAGTTPTYISGTSFSVATDLTGTYTVGRRIKATCSGGTIYGTVVSSAYSTVTTVTILCDSGTLDSGMSAVSVGIITPSSSSVPVTSVSTKTTDYTIDITDFGKILIANKETAIAFTVPAANTLPSGWYVTIINIGAGTLTITGTVNGVSNPTMAQYAERRIFTNASAWYSSGNYAGTAGTAAYASSVDDGSITGAKLQSTTAAGTDLYLAKCPTVRTLPAYSDYTLNKQTEALQRGGVVTVSWTGYDNGYRLYRNSTLLTSGLSGGGYVSYNTTASVGDVFYLHQRAAGEYGAQASEFYVMAKDPFIAGEVR